MQYKTIESWVFKMNLLLFIKKIINWQICPGDALNFLYNTVLH